MLADNMLAESHALLVLLQVKLLSSLHGLIAMIL